MDPVEVTEAAVVQVEEVEEWALVENMTVGGARVVAAEEETTTKDTRQPHEELTDTEVEVGQEQISVTIIVLMCTVVNVVIITLYFTI